MDAMLAAVAARKNVSSAALPVNNPPAVTPAGESSQSVLGLMNAMKAALGGGMRGAGTPNPTSAVGSGYPRGRMLDAGGPKVFAYERTSSRGPKSTRFR